MQFVCDFFMVFQTNGVKSPEKEVAPPAEGLNGNGEHKVVDVSSFDLILFYF